MNQVAYIQLLPEDLLHKIGAHLDDERSLCRMERASKRFHDVLSRPSATVFSKVSLDLVTARARTPGESRLPVQLASPP